MKTDVFVVYFLFYQDILSSRYSLDPYHFRNSTKRVPTIYVGVNYKIIIIDTLHV